MNRKGQVEDMFDYLFTAGIGLALLFFFWWAFDRSVDGANTASLHDTAEFRRLDSATNNLRADILTGGDYDPEKLPALIANSKVLSGRVITTCRDYYLSEDCNGDRVNLYPDAMEYCLWNEGEGLCRYQRAGGVRI